MLVGLPRSKNKPIKSFSQAGWACCSFLIPSLLPGCPPFLPTFSGQAVFAYERRTEAGRNDYSRPEGRAHANLLFTPAAKSNEQHRGQRFRVLYLLYRLLETATGLLGSFRCLCAAGRRQAIEQIPKRTEGEVQAHQTASRI